MGKHTFYVILTLAVVWIIMMENISWRTIGTGLLVVIVVMHFERKFLPYEEIKDVNFFKLATYPFFLIGQIYLSGWQVIKMVITGCRIDVVNVRTPLKSDTLRFILGDSITLIPGSVLLEIEGDKLTVLWIVPTKTPQLNEEQTEEMMKGKLERRLGSAEREID